MLIVPSQGHIAPRGFMTEDKVPFEPCPPLAMLDLTLRLDEQRPRPPIVLKARAIAGVQLLLDERDQDTQRARDLGVTVRSPRWSSSLPSR